MSEIINEKSVSKSQQKLFGAVHACQKKGKCVSDKIRELAKSIKPKDTEDFAKTKHEGLPEKKEKEDKKEESVFPTFKEWMNLKEVGTGTSAVACFKAPIGSLEKEDEEDGDRNKKKKSKKKD